MSRNVEFLLRVNTQGFSAQMKAAADSFKSSLASISSSAASTGSRVKSGLAQADGRGLKELSSSAALAQGGMEGLTGRVLRLAAAYVSLRGVISGVTAAITTGGEFERLNVQLKSVMGSAQGGEQAFAWIRRFTAETPYQLEDVTKGFVKLKAFGMDPMDGAYQAIADAASKLGGSQETLGGIALAVGQAWTKQKLQGQEIMQLAERGVPVWDLLSKAMGKTAPELMAMSEAGELGRKEIKLLLDEMGRWGDGASAAQMGTWTGMVSNAKDMVAEFYNEISQAGALDYFKGQIKAGIDEIKRMKEDGRLAEWAAGISDAIVLATGGVKSLVTSLIEMRMGITAVGAAVAAFKVASWVQSIASATSALGGMAVAGGGAAAALAPLALALAAGGAAVAAYGLYAKRQVDAAREQERASMDLAKSITGLADAQRQLNQMGYGESKAAASVARMKEFGVQLAQARRMGVEVDTSAYTQAAQAAQAGMQEILRTQEQLAAARGQHDDAVEQKRKAVLAGMTNAERLFKDEVWKLSGEALQKKIADAEKELDATRNKLDQAVQAEQKARDKLLQAEAGRTAQVQSTEDKLREIRRRGMTETEKQADTENQAYQKKQAAWRAYLDAVSSGSPQAIAAAKNLAQEAEGMYMSLSDSSKATAGVKETGKILAWLADKEVDAAKEADAAAAKKSQSLTDQVTKLEALVAAAKEKVVIDMDADISAAEKNIDDLQAKLDKLTDKTITITAKTVEGHSAGGPILALNRGAHLPGYGGGDRIQALLEAGEYINRKESVRKYGANLFAALNSLKLDPVAVRALVSGRRYQTGGPVLPFSNSILSRIHIPEIPVFPPLRLAGGGAVSAPVKTYEIKFGQRSVVTTSSPDAVQEFVDAMQRQARMM